MAAENMNPIVDQEVTVEMAERQLKIIEKCNQQVIRLEASLDQINNQIEQCVKELRELGFDEENAEAQIAERKKENYQLYQETESKIPYDLLEKLGVKLDD